MNTVYAHVRANGVHSQVEYDQVQRLMSLGTNSPEEYMDSFSWP